MPNWSDVSWLQVTGPEEGIKGKYTCVRSGYAVCIEYVLEGERGEKGSLRCFCKNNLRRERSGACSFPFRGTSASSIALYGWRASLRYSRREKMTTETTEALTLSKLCISCYSKVSLSLSLSTLSTKIVHRRSAIHIMIQQRRDGHGSWFF